MSYSKTSLLTVKDVQQLSGMSFNTAKVYVSDIKKKYGIPNNRKIAYYHYCDYFLIPIES